METALNQFRADYATIQSLFTSLGVADQARDGVFFGYSRGELARQLGALRRKGVPEADLLGAMRQIYGAIDAEIRGGSTPRNVAEPMALALIDGWTP